VATTKRSKFIYGDKVITPDNNRGKVVSVYTIGKEYYCKVKFDNAYLMPSEMEYHQDAITAVSSTSFSYKAMYNSSSQCPICGENWNKMNSPIFGKSEIWIDCLKCKKKKEDIMEEYEKNH